MGEVGVIGDVWGRPTVRVFLTTAGGAGLLVSKFDP